MESVQARGLLAFRTSMVRLKACGTDLSGSRILRCQLIEADLRNASLRGIDLNGSILDNVFVDGTDFRGSYGELVDCRLLVNAEEGFELLTGPDATAWLRSQGSDIGVPPG